jgi:hypothetical protein
MEEILPYREVTHHIRFAREEAASVIPYRINSRLSLDSIYVVEIRIGFV